MSDECQELWNDTLYAVTINNYVGDLWDRENYFNSDIYSYIERDSFVFIKDNWEGREDDVAMNDVGDINIMNRYFVKDVNWTYFVWLDCGEGWCYGMGSFIVTKNTDIIPNEFEYETCN